jgi:hypothetical protein
MAQPSHDMSKLCKGMLMHMRAFGDAPRFGGPACTSLKLASPTIPPFTKGAKEYGLHAFVDAGGNDTKGISAVRLMLGGAALDTLSQRQHLAAPESHTIEIVAAGTALHRIIPIRGILQELHIIQEMPMPLYIDSASTVFVAMDRASVKRSIWLRRRAVIVQEGVELGEILPTKISERDNCSDVETKYLIFKIWARHMHYTHNLPGDAPDAE